MTKIFVLILFLGFHSCGQKTGKKKFNPEVTALSMKILPLISFRDNPDSCRKAVAILDSATAIDKKCFLCYQNKIYFLYSLKDFTRAIHANDTLINFAPNAHDLYLTGGILAESNNDTNTAKIYFQKSLKICNAVLDTMDKENYDYPMFVSNKAINLVMLDEQIKANEVLKNLHDSLPDEPDFDNMTKKLIKLFMNKSKAELREIFLHPENIR